nr:putative ribonuclease H-like domain-containing protein [Tanacetum cinerariifolium]
MSDHEDETITKENTPAKVVPQITTITNISVKFPYLKEGDAKSMTTDNDGHLKIRHPVTAEEHIQVQREEKARMILLFALPDEHMGDFYHMIDARDIWNAIKARFSGNAESKKMQKSLLKQKFEEFKISEEEGLDKGYDKMQKILTQMNTLKIKPEQEDVNMKFLRGLPPFWSSIVLILKTKGGLEYISFDDLYNKLMFLEIDTKGYSSSSSTLSNAAFVSTTGSSQGNLSYQESGDGGYTTTFSVSPRSSSSKGSSKSKCSVVDDVIYSFFANHEIDQHLVYEDLDQMNKEDFEEYDLKHQMAMLSIKLAKCFNCKQMGHFSRECQAQDKSDLKAMVVVDGSIDWDKQTKAGNTEPRSLENFGMITRIKIESDADSEGEVVSADDAIHAGVSVSAGNVAAVVFSLQSETEFALIGFLLREGKLGIDDFKVSIFHTNSDELEGQPIYNRFALVDYMKVVPSPLTGNYMPPSNIPDIDESQMVDRSSKPSTNDFQTCDSSMECSRPNHSDHDSTDFISIVSAPIREKNVPDESISVHLYRSMIGCLMYLTATRLDIMFAVCAAARHQVTPKTSNLLSVKRIFKYLTAYHKLGLWYPQDSPFDLEAFSDSDYAGANGDRKSTTGGCRFLRRRLISWQCKKQTIVATSSCKAEYVAAASCCGQWFLFTSGGSVTFCWLFLIPAGDLVSDGHMFFLLLPFEIITAINWYALTTNPTIYASVVRQFWGSALEVSLPDGARGLVATIDGTTYTVTKASIRSALQLDDLNAIDTMTNEKIFAKLRDIGYTTEGKLTFFKNKFSPQWKFLIHTLIHCLSPKSGSWNQLASHIAIALIYLSTGRKYNFSNMIFNGPDMPLLAHMLNLEEPTFKQAQQLDVYQPPPSLVVTPHPSPDTMPSPPRQSSPPPIPFGPTTTSGVVSTEPILDIPSSSIPYKPVLKTINSPFRDDDTGGGSLHESPPRPPPATSTISPTVGVAKEPLTLTSLLALFLTSLQRIATLEAKLKATKILHRDTVLFMHQVFLPLLLSLLIQNSLQNRKSVQKSSSGLDFTDVDIPAGGLDSTGGLDCAGGLNFTGGLDSAGGVDSTGGLTSSSIFVVAGPTVPAKSSSPLRDPSKGKTELRQSINAEQVYLDSLLAQRVAEEQDRESMASEEQSTQRQAELDKVALNLTNEELIGLVDQVRAHPTLSAELLGADVSEDTFSVRMSSAIYTTGWTWKFVRGLNDDQLRIEYDKIRRAVDLATAKDQHQHLKRLGETLKSLESKKLKSSHSTTQPAELQETTFVSTCVPIAAGDLISADFSVSVGSSIPAATPIAADVSTTAGASSSASEASVPIIELFDSPLKDTSLPLDLETEDLDEPLRKYSRKKSIAEKRTLPSPSKPKSDAFPFDKDDLEAAFKRADGAVKRFSTLRELLYWASRADLMVLYGLVSNKYKTERATGIGFGLWMDLRILITSREERDASIIWDDQDQWQIRSWRFYAILAIHVLETKAGDIMYMFVDKKYPLTPATLQRILNHGLENDRDLSGNDLTTAIQLIQSLLN